MNTPLEAPFERTDLWREGQLLDLWSVVHFLSGISVGFGFYVLGFDARASAGTPHKKPPHLSRICGKNMRFNAPYLCSEEHDYANNSGIKSRQIISTSFGKSET